ncbi:MAG TPA: phage tail assembly protein [Kofleriaceae bacterium]|nr:phage tail assembly protein [Kofleriaceae bacterium]
MAFRTEFPFRLPKGYVDPETGKLHRDGVMRLATARDEILPLQDYRVQANRAYLVIVLLSRVIVKLGSLDRLGVDTIENLFSTDLAYLQDFYRKINEEGAPRHQVVCPKCEHPFEIDMASGQVIGPEGAEEGGEGRAGQG